MTQFMFFVLLLVALMGGLIAYFGPSSKPIQPIKFAMENSGFNDAMTINRKKTELINVKTRKGLTQFHEIMEQTARAQDKIRDYLNDQQQILNDSQKGAADLLAAARSKGEVNSKDLLRLQGLVQQMQNEQTLLVVRGRDLVAMNNQLTMNRELLAEQVDLSDVGTQNSLNNFRARYARFNDEANNFFDAVNNYNQQVRGRMEDIRAKLDGMRDALGYNTTARLETLRKQVCRMLEIEREKAMLLADVQERQRLCRQETEEQVEDAKDRLNSSLQRCRDTIEMERQKAEDQRTAREE